MDTSQWSQELGLVKPMGELMSSTPSTTVTTSINNCTNTISTNTARALPNQQVMERRARPQKEQPVNCPRCNSLNTKFCYYNNYSLTQPRYFCKTCRRYWTEGGSLRNVPVGGGSKKNKRSSSLTLTSTNAPNANKLPTDQLINPAISLSIAHQTPKLVHEGQDLNLAFPHPNIAEFNEFTGLENSGNNNNGNNVSSISSGSNVPCTNVGVLSSMDFLRSNGMTGRAAGLGHFLPMPVPAQYQTMFGMQELRPSVGAMSFGIGGSNGGYGSVQGVPESSNGSRLMFAFEDLKTEAPATTTDADQEFEQHRGGGAGNPPGFWSGMIGGGGSW